MTSQFLLKGHKMPNSLFTETLKAHISGTEADIKGNLRLSKALVKEREKWKKNEESLTSMRQIVFEISHFKVRNLSKMDEAIL